VVLQDTSETPHKVLERIISDHRYSDEDFALILRKAGELQHLPAEDRTSGLTLAEMKSVASEAGIDPALIERAAALMPRAAPQSVGERLIGGPVKYWLERSVPGEPSEEQMARLVPAIRAAYQHFGAVEESSSSVAWRTVGEASQVFVTATREGEATRLRVTADRGGGLLLTGFLNVMAGVVVAGITGAIIDPASNTVGALIMGGGLAGGLTMARTMWSMSTRSMRAKLDAVMDDLARELERDD
jgi:hypothetical protein